VLTLIASIGAIAFGGLATWLVTRRKSSGRIGTSEAAELWGESKAMRDLLATQLEKVESQRDRLIEGQAGQVLPLLSGLSTSMSDMARAIETVIGHDEKDRQRGIRMEQLLTQIAEALNGASSGRAAKADPGPGRRDRRSARRGPAADQRAAADHEPDRGDSADPAGAAR